MVLNFGTVPETLRAVRSICESSRPIAPVIVVDNGATAESAVALEAAGDGIEYLPSGRNLGFSGGVNLGIREALARGAARVLLVNSDATVEPDAVERLESALDADESLGIVGPVILDRGVPGHVVSRGISYDAATGRMRELGPRDGDGDGDDDDALSSGGLQGTDAVSGCVMLVDRRVFDAVGLFDEAYFFSFEDVDFCLRARRAGFRAGVVPAARARHDGSRSIGARSPGRLYYATRNHLRLAERVSGTDGSFRKWSRRLAIVGFNAVHALRATPAAVPARLAAMASGVRDYARGRFGAAPV